MHNVTNTPYNQQNNQIIGKIIQQLKSFLCMNIEIHHFQTIMITPNFQLCSLSANNKGLNYFIMIKPNLNRKLVNR